MHKNNLSVLPIVDETNLYDPRLMIKKAKGNYIWFENNSQPYLDLIMGYSSTNFGHNNPEIIKCVERALQKGDNIPAFNFSERIELSKKLLGYMPNHGRNYQVYYPVGGTKAVDAAIKLAIIYTQKKDIIAFHGSFQGYSINSISITDKRFFNRKYDIFNARRVIKFPFSDANKNHDWKKNIERISETLAKNKNIAALIIEPVQGAAGFIQANTSFLKHLEELCKQYQIVFIVDEIQTGLGRTGEFYAFNRAGIKPDIVLLGKSLAGGFYPLSAVIAKKQYFDAVGGYRSGFDSTFANNIFGIGIAKGVINYLEKNNILEKVKRKEIIFKKEMDKIKNKYPFIRGMNIIGLACSLEIIDDKTAQKIKQRAFQKHVIIQTAGIRGNYIKLSPSLIISGSELKSAIKKLDEILDSLS